MSHGRIAWAVLIAVLSFAIEPCLGRHSGVVRTYLKKS